MWWLMLSCGTEPELVDTEETGIEEEIVYSSSQRVLIYDGHGGEPGTSTGVGVRPVQRPGSEGDGAVRGLRVRMTHSLSAHTV